MLAAVSFITAPAVRFIAAPATIEVAVEEFIAIAPAATLTLNKPVTTLLLYPVAPEVTDIGPAGLATIYLGIASAAEPAGVMTVSQEPPIFLMIPAFILGIGDGGKLIVSNNVVVAIVIELSADKIISPALHVC